VVIFPEGRITLTGSLMKVYDGPAFVAAKTGATVVPVRLDGASRSYFSRLSGRHIRALFPKIRLTVLPERHFPMPEGATAKLRRRKSGEAMRKLMQEMIFASRPQQTCTPRCAMRRDPSAAVAACWKTSSRSSIPITTC
jgi:acyl-[acyl-carrier-protein]-phospholipid O-acyltransferase/long-chain-fatty-acid--[acyl-carrier-protein] ligase